MCTSVLEFIKNPNKYYFLDNQKIIIQDVPHIKLDDIVFLQSEKLKGKTILRWLKEPIGSHSPDNFLKVIEKLEYIRSLNLERAINYKESIGEYIYYNLIIHISPLGWEHINILGEYTFNLNELETKELHRPLNI